MVIRLLQEFLQIYLECLSFYKFYVSLAKSFEILCGKLLSIWLYKTT